MHGNHDKGTEDVPEEPKIDAAMARASAERPFALVALILVVSCCELFQRSVGVVPDPTNQS